MKKFLVGLLLGVGISISATVAANPYGLPWTNHIYNIPNANEGHSTVSVFDDADNKCYIAQGYSTGVAVHMPVSISCVKR